MLRLRLRATSAGRYRGLRPVANRAADGDGGGDVAATAGFTGSATFSVPYPSSDEKDPTGPDPDLPKEGTLALRLLDAMSGEGRERYLKALRFYSGGDAAASDGGGGGPLMARLLTVDVNFPNILVGDKGAGGGPGDYSNSNSAGETHGSSAAASGEIRADEDAPDGKTWTVAVIVTLAGGAALVASAVAFLLYRRHHGRSEVQIKELVGCLAPSVDPGEVKRREQGASPGGDGKGVATGGFYTARGGRGEGGGGLSPSSPSLSTHPTRYGRKKRISRFGRVRRKRNDPNGSSSPNAHHDEDNSVVFSVAASSVRSGLFGDGEDSLAGYSLEGHSRIDDRAPNITWNDKTARATRLLVAPNARARGGGGSGSLGFDSSDGEGTDDGLRPGRFQDKNGNRDGIETASGGPLSFAGSSDGTGISVGDDDNDGGGGANVVTVWTYDAVGPHRGGGMGGISVQMIDAGGGAGAGTGLPSTGNPNVTVEDPIPSLGRFGTDDSILSGIGEDEHYDGVGGKKGIDLDAMLGTFDAIPAHYDHSDCDVKERGGGSGGIARHRRRRRQRQLRQRGVRQPRG